MQKPNFPNEVFQVAAQPGKANCGHPKVRITRIPARFTDKSACTLNGRGLKLDSFGKFSTYARSTKIHIVTGYTRTREDAVELATRMLIYIASAVQRDIEDLQNLKLGVRFEPIIEDRDYED